MLLAEAHKRSGALEPPCSRQALFQRRNRSSFPVRMAVSHTPSTTPLSIRHSRLLRELFHPSSLLCTEGRPPRHLLPTRAKSSSGPVAVLRSSMSTTAAAPVTAAPIDNH